MALSDRFAATTVSGSRPACTGALSRSGRRGRPIRLLQILQLVRLEPCAEIEQTVQRVMPFEILGMARQMNEAAGLEAALLEIRQSNSPRAAFDGRAAVAALRLAG